MMCTTMMNKSTWGLVLLVVVVTSAHPVEETKDTGDRKRIINGHDAELFSNPSIASIQLKDGGHQCGGVLISKTQVLTAAHCLEDTSPRDWRVVLGAVQINQTWTKPYHHEQVIEVTSFEIHERYSDLTDEHDIAIISLENPAVLFDDVQIATLANRGTRFTHAYCYIAGWGNTIDFGNIFGYPTTLQEKEVRVIPNKVCAAEFKKLNTAIKKEHICVAETFGSDRGDACDADSGGPLYCGPNLDIVAGILSFGGPTCRGDYPSVYTRVSFHFGWIMNRIKEEVDTA